MTKKHAAYTSQPVTIVREVRRVIAPASIRCALCKLYAGDDETPPGVYEIGIKYNGDGLMPENPLVALNRRRYICDDCVDAINGGHAVAGNAGGAAGT